MIYQKNVPAWERVLRVVVGVLFIGVAIAGETVWGGQSAIITGVLLFTALFVVATGFVGWCPACTLVGRKLKNNS